MQWSIVETHICGLCGLISSLLSGDGPGSLAAIMNVSLKGGERPLAFLFKMAFLLPVTVH